MSNFWSSVTKSKLSYTKILVVLLLDDQEVLLLLAVLTTIKRHFYTFRSSFFFAEIVTADIRHNKFTSIQWFCLESSLVNMLRYVLQYRYVNCFNLFHYVKGKRQCRKFFRTSPLWLREPVAIEKSEICIEFQRIGKGAEQKFLINQVFKVMFWMQRFGVTASSRSKIL